MFTTTDAVSLLKCTIADIDSVLDGSYIAKHKKNVKKWNSIKSKKKNFVINAPIHIGSNESEQESKEINLAKSTQKINKPVPKGEGVVPPPTLAAVPPPVIFQNRQGRKDHNFVLMLVGIILGALVFFVGSYIVYKYFK